MSSRPVLEVARLRLHPTSITQYPIDRIATPDLPASFANTWRQICSSTSTAAGHHFRLYRSIIDPSNFFFIGGWDSPAEHTKVLARDEDKKLATSLGKWMEHQSVRHIAGDIHPFDSDGWEENGLVVLTAWKVGVENIERVEKTWKENREERPELREVAGWGESAGALSEHEELEDMAGSRTKEVTGVSNGKASSSQQEERCWVAVRFVKDGEADALHDGGDKRKDILKFVLGSRSPAVVA